MTGGGTPAHPRRAEDGGRWAAGTAAPATRDDSVRAAVRPGLVPAWRRLWRKHLSEKDFTPPGLRPRPSRGDRPPRGRARQEERAGGSDIPLWQRSGGQAPPGGPGRVGPGARSVPGPGLR